MPQFGWRRRVVARARDRPRGGDELASLRPSPPEDVMTTTAVRPRRVSHRDGDLMSSTFEIKQRPPGELPSPEDGEQVGVMRSRTRERLTARGLAYVADEAVLIVSELVTNAVVHSGGREITVTLSPQRLPAHRRTRRCLQLSRTARGTW
jgi:hypothetical protein